MNIINYYTHIKNNIPAVIKRYHYALFYPVYSIHVFLIRSQSGDNGEQVLRDADNDDSVGVTNITLSSPTGKGDNYASDIYRVTVKLSRTRNGVKITEITSVVVKVEISDGVWREMVVNKCMFEREMSMMMKTLPTMNRMLAEFSATSLSARCLRVQSEHPMYLVIEDLVPRGFRMAESRGNLGLDHCLLAMRNIAAFHAASVAIADKDPKALKEYERYKKHLNPTPSYTLFITSSVKVLGEEVASWPELVPRISEKLSKLSDVILDKECEAALFCEDDFNVLNHGDFTSINVLFRYDEEGRPVEQIFVDFQLSRYGSPAIDIFNFLATSSSLNVRLDDRELLLREYHNSLIGYMAKFKCSTKAPSFAELQDILRKRAFCEVTPSLTIFAHAIADRNDNKSGNEWLSSNEKSSFPVYKGKMFRTVMTRVLPMFDSMGLLDV